MKAAGEMRVEENVWDFGPDRPGRPTGNGPGETAMTVKSPQKDLNPEYLTRLEELFLLAILRLGEPAYLVNIRRYLLRHAGKDWAFGSLYVSLAKLERRGLVRTHLGAPKGGRGGKAIKYYDVTPDGLAALAEAKKYQDEMWRGFPAFALKAASHGK
jgi:PadR family transcriptional regulator PadR